MTRLRTIVTDGLRLTRREVRKLESRPEPRHKGTRVCKRTNVRETPADRTHRLARRRQRQRGLVR